MYHMMSTPALLKSDQRKAPRSPLSSQDSNAPKSADIKCGSLLISRQHRKDLSSVASITPLAQALIRGEVRWKEQMPFSILAARLCLVGSKVGARVQSLGDVLERADARSARGRTVRSCRRKRRVLPSPNSSGAWSMPPQQAQPQQWSWWNVCPNTGAPIQHQHRFERCGVARRMQQTLHSQRPGCLLARRSSWAEPLEDE